MRDLQELFDAVDLTIGRAASVVGMERAEAGGAAVRDLRRRRGYIGSTLVVALAGGTGSGKSSLLNAIAGEEVASVSRLRPHTELPLAWVPKDADSAIGSLLDSLDITERHRHDVLPGLAILDMPDMDSFADMHRHTVERLIPKVDALIWVLDPEKYRDEALHRDFLAPLAVHADQTVFVLNKTDRVPPTDLDAVEDDVLAALRSSGYEAPKVFATAASPGTGEPVGIAALVGFLGDEMDRKKVAHGKLLGDIAGVVKGLAEDAGVWEGAGVGFTRRWSTARDRAVGAMTARTTTPTEEILCRLEDVLAATAVDAGFHAAAEMRDAVGSDDIGAAVAEAQSEVAAGRPEMAGAVLDQSLAGPIRQILWGRSEFAATATLAHIGAREIASRTGVWPA